MDAAKRIISEHREAMERLVDHLLEHEGIEKAELGKLLGPGAPRENPVEVVPAA
jgi:ATP-dependent Zn protease